MPVQFDDNASPQEPHDSQPTSAPVTIIGLFEDDIDTCRALLQLRKCNAPPSAVSVVLRLADADDEAPANRNGVLARAIATAGFQQLADWLAGLVTVMAPQRGLYLVAGPVGASLAGEHVEDHGHSAGQSAVATVLAHFGFSHDEAAYMDARLLSGSLLVGVTSSDRDVLQRASQTFSSENAVYIPTAATDAQVAAHATHLLNSPPELSTDGDVVVTDAVARFFQLCDSGRASQDYLAARNSHVVDPDGHDVGVIVDFIAETLSEPGDCDEVRYAIVAFGGILGIGRHHAAIPIDRFDLASSPIRVNVSRDLLRDAPAFNLLAPFSRREEHTVCSYFGATPYWSDTA